MRTAEVVESCAHNRGHNADMGIQTFSTRQSKVYMRSLSSEGDCHDIISRIRHTIRVKPRTRSAYFNLSSSAHRQAEQARWRRRDTPTGLQREPLESRYRGTLPVSLRAIEPVVVVRLQFTTNRPRRSSKYNGALSVGNPMNENDGAAKPHDSGTAYNQDY